MNTEAEIGVRLLQDQAPRTDATPAAGEAGKDPSWESLEGPRPSDTRTVDFWPQTGQGTLLKLEAPPLSGWPPRTPARVAWTQGSNVRGHPLQHSSALRTGSRRLEGCQPGRNKHRVSR